MSCQRSVLCRPGSRETGSRGEGTSGLVSPMMDDSWITGFPWSTRWLGEYAALCNLGWFSVGLMPYHLAGPLAAGCWLTLVRESGLWDILGFVIWHVWVCHFWKCCCLFLISLSICISFYSFCHSLSFSQSVSLFSLLWFKMCYIATWIQQYYAEKSLDWWGKKVKKIKESVVQKVWMGDKWITVMPVLVHCPIS